MEDDHDEWGEVLQGAYPELAKITYIWCFGRALLDHAGGGTSRARLAGRVQVCAVRVLPCHRVCGRYKSSACGAQKRSSENSSSTRMCICAQ